jgi:hypothetical protein
MFRYLVLLATALSIGLVASHDRLLHLKESCGEGETQTLYFNFFIKLDVPDSCEGDDFEAIGRLIQSLIGDIEGLIPDYQNVFIQADVCPAPNMLLKRSRARFLRDIMHRMLGKYSYGGGGTCKRCAMNKRVIGGTIQTRDWRNLEGSVAERACAIAEVANDNFYIAKSSCEAANATLAEMSIMVESMKKSKPKDTMPFVEEAKKALLDCDTRKKNTRSMAKIVTEICKEARRSVDEDQFESSLEVETAAAALQASTMIDQLVAEKDFCKIKYQWIQLKTMVSKLSKYDKVYLKGTLDKLNLDIKKLDEKIKETTTMSATDKVKNLEGSVAERACAIADVAAEDSFDIAKRSYEAAKAKLEDVLEMMESAKYAIPKDTMVFVEEPRRLFWTVV